MNKKLVFSLLVNIIVLGLLAGCLTIDVDLPYDDDEDHLVAYYFGTPPSIDGDLSEWDLDHPLMTIGPNSDVFRGSIDSSEDFTMHLYLGWDYENIYLALEVVDDSIVTEVLEVVDDSIVTEVGFWDFDNVTLLFDANNDSKREDYESDYPATAEWQDDDYRLIIQPVNRVSIQTNSSFVYLNPQSSFVPLGDGYRYECRIKISDLPYVMVENGHVIGFDVSIRDVDADGDVLSFTEAVYGGLGTDPWGGLAFQYWLLSKLKLVE